MDRSRACYRCGEEGHQATGCLNPVACALCKHAGRDYNHRVGSTQCAPAAGSMSGNRSSQKEVSTSMEVVKEESVRRSMDTTNSNNA